MKFTALNQLQEKPDKEIILENGARNTPLATLKDEYGGVAQICIDDHCYVLYLLYCIESRLGGKSEFYSSTTHWFTEAVVVLKKMPLPTGGNKEQEELFSEELEENGGNEDSR